MTSINLNRQRLIKCRENLGITKQEAAKRMHLSQPAYLRYENGDRTPSIHVIQTMADVLGTSVAYLTDETNVSEPDCYIIRSDVDPELFLLVEEFKKSNHDAKQRFSSYIKKMSESK